MALVDEAGDALPQLRRRVDVDLAAHLDDGRGHSPDASRETGPRLLLRLKTRTDPDHPSGSAQAAFNHVLHTWSVEAGPRGSNRRPLADLLAAAPDRAERLTHVEVLPPREGIASRLAGVDTGGPRRALAGAAGSSGPWAHQVEAAEAARAGRHVVLATGTASGKSLAFQLPALTAVLEARRPERAPRSDRCSTSPRPRRWPRTSSHALGVPPGARARGLHPRRGQPSGAAGLGEGQRGVRPHQPRHAPPLAAPRPRALGAVLLPAAATSSSTSATTTAGSSAPTSRWCSGGCAGSRVVRRLAHLRARLSHRCRPGQPPPDGSPGCRSRRSPRTVGEGPGVAGPLGAPVHLLRRGERRPGTAGRDRRGGRPARRPGGRRGPDARLRPLPQGRRVGRADRRPAARRGRAWAVEVGGGLPGRLPPRGPAAAGVRPPRGTAPRDGCHQRAGAGHRHRRAGRGAAWPASPARGQRCGSRWAGRGARAPTPWRCWSPETTRSTPTSSRTRRRWSERRSRRRSSTRATPTCWVPTSARPRPSFR